MEQKKTEEFKVVFEYWGSDVLCQKCGFCGDNEAEWWCEWLVEGWCDDCMKMQRDEK